MTTLRFLLILLLVLNALAFAAVQSWLGGAAPRGEAGRLGAQLDPQRIRLAADAVDAAPAAAPAADENTAGAAEAPAAAAPVDPPAPTEPAAEAPVAEAPAPSDPAPASSADAAAVSPPPEQTPSAPEQEAPAPAAVAEAAPAAPAQSCFAWADLTADEAEQLAQRLGRAGFSASRSRVDTPNSWWVRVPPQASREQAERRVQELRQLGVTDTYIVPDSGPTQFAISLGVFKTENRARQLLNQLQARGVRNAGIAPRMSTSYRVQASLPAERLRAIESAQRGLGARRAACTGGG